MSALRATQTPKQSWDLEERRDGQGACSCGLLRTFEDCTCGWGALIRRAIRVAYWSPAEDASQEIASMMIDWMPFLGEQRRSLIQRLADNWTGTITAFRERYGIPKNAYERLGIKMHR